MLTLLGSRVSVRTPRLPGEGALAAVLRGRGLASGGAEADKFFAPSEADFHDPALLPDMAAAVARIVAARGRGERVILFGDYDVDGVSSVALMFRFMSANGWQVSYRLPHRVDDGYGFKPHFLEELPGKGVKLVVTLDCGTKDAAAVARAKELGIDVVVVDHHAVPEKLPEGASAVVNPHRADSAYPFPDLSASGLAFKLCHALCRELFGEGEALSRALGHLEIAMLGTVADCVPLIGENRAIAALGLARLARSPVPALRALFAERGEKPLDADFVGFQVGPLINAAGRMDTPMRALRMLLADERSAQGTIDDLKWLNGERRRETAEAVELALKESDLSAPAVVWRTKAARHGIIGLVAAKLAEASGKPAAVLHDAGDKMVASVRSPHWFSTVDWLGRMADLFAFHGGHRQAGGFTLLPENWDAFLARSASAAAEMSLGADTSRALSAETEISAAEADMDFCRGLFRMAPFGVGNEKPLFLVRGVRGRLVPLGKDGKHLRLEIAGSKLRANAFGFGRHAEALAGRASFDIVAEAGVNAWMGNSSAELTVRDFVVG